MLPTMERSYIAPRNVRPFDITDVSRYADLAKIGIALDEKNIDAMFAYAQDAIIGPVTSGSLSSPVQFLQNWLPGFVNILTAARNIDELVGISTTGQWEDEEVVQGILEYVGKAQPYGDYTDIPLSSWNNQYERRSVVRFEEGLRVGVEESLRAARIGLDAAQGKRDAAAMALEIQRNAVGFFGYNSGQMRNYGFLNDPSLPAYVTVAVGASASTLWSTKTYLEITNDIRAILASLRASSGAQIDPNKTPITLAIASNAVDYLTVTSSFGNSIYDFLNKTYPQLRIVSAPELNAANGGANVMYAYADTMANNGTDDGRVFTQIVPAKFKLIGVEQRAKAYLEDYSNATAGVLVKRPYAVARRSGI